MLRIARALAGLVLVAGAMALLPALAQAPSATPDDGGINRRMIDGTVVFPSEVFRDDPFIAVRTDVLIPVEIRRAGTASDDDTSQPAAAPHPARAAIPDGGLGGAWSGHWTDERDGRRRPAELIITAGRDPSQLIGQLTLMGGARTWTARYEGTATEGGARFPLPGGGMITVHRTADDRLTGEFSAPAGPLPAQTGALDLSRVR